MLYFIALLCPPLALALCLKPIQAVLNGILYVTSMVLLFFGGTGAITWAICAVHAIMVVSSTAADRRHRQLMRQMQTHDGPA